MTLVVGLVCKDSIVFSADSEESDSLRKSSVQKTRYAPHIGHALVTPKERLTSIEVSGAGNGTLCDYAAQKITEQAFDTSSASQALEIIENILIDIYKTHVPPIDPSNAVFNLLIGIKAPQDYAATLYSTDGVTILRREKYFAWGSGSVTDYILDQVYSEGMTTEDGISASLFMLQTAKSYISGVGGDSQVVVLRNDGRIEEKPFWEISEEENIARQFTFISGILLLSTMRTREGSNEEFLTSVRKFTASVKQLRKKKQKSDEYIRRLFSDVSAR